MDYFDTKPPGLGLRVTSRGYKSWFVMYRANGRLRRYTLGAYPALSLADARQRALDVRHSVAHGGDPAASRQAERLSPTVAELTRQYIDLSAKVHDKSWREQERLLTKDVLPVWGQRKASQITRREVIALLDGIMARGAPIVANRTLAWMRRMYNWGISRDLLEHNPCLQVPAPGKEQTRERVLSGEEIRAIWTACASLDVVSGAYMQVVMLTAQRCGEVRTMRWEDIDLETGWWVIPGSAVKNGLAHRVPLSPPVRALLQQMQDHAGQNPWVFRSPRLQQRPIANMQRAAQLLRSHAGVRFTLHDLRRTAASHMGSLGIPRLTIGKVLNHAESGVTRIYDRHTYDREKRQALEAWETKVLALVEHAPGSRPVEG
jgi:integrase